MWDPSDKTPSIILCAQKIPRALAKRQLRHTHVVKIEKMKKQLPYKLEPTHFLPPLLVVPTRRIPLLLVVPTGASKKREESLRSGGIPCRDLLSRHRLRIPMARDPSAQTFVLFSDLRSGRRWGMDASVGTTMGDGTTKGRGGNEGGDDDGQGLRSGRRGCKEQQKPRLRYFFLMNAFTSANSSSPCASGFTFS